MTPGLGIAVTLVLLALNGFFVAAEFALVAARRSAVELRAEQGSRRATVALRSMEHLSLMLAGAQLGITVCSLALGAVSEPAIAHLLEPPFAAVGLPEAAVHPSAFVLALLLVTGLHVVLGEMVPKNVTLAEPDTAAVWLAAPLAAVVQVFRPLIWALNETTNLILRAVRVQPRAEVASTVTRDELAGVVDESRREGLLDADDHELLTNAISFETATAADLTLPLDRVHSLPPGPSAEAVEQLAAGTGVGRFPVRDGDELLGYIHLKDIFDTAAERRATPLPDSTLRPLPTVRADLPLTDAVELMRARKAHMARVVAAGAGRRTVGIITLDDILTSLTRA
jgi:CBS domain containing-hemolysin-like protein